MKSSAVLASLLCCTIFIPVSAFGDDTAQCITSLENGQVMRKNGRLQEAQKAFTRCAERACPSSLQLQCGKFLEEVEAAIPSLIFNVTIDGEDTTDARIEMDGTLLTDNITPRAIEVEPGLHKFVVTVTGFAPVERKLMIREGEQRKNIQVALTRPKTEAKTQVPGTGSTAGDSGAASKRPVPLGVWITGGIGVAGLILGATFEVMGQSSQSRLETNCKPQCSNDDVNAVHANYVAGDIALGVGAASLITAGVWYFLRPNRLESTTSPTDRPSVSIVPGLRSLQLQATF